MCAKATAALVVLLGASVLLLGWGADIDRVRRLSPSLPGTAISTCIGFIIFGACLLATGPSTGPSAGRGRRVIVAMLAAVALTFALVNLALLAAGSPGVDQLVFDFPDARSEIHMSPAASICLALVAACLFIRLEGGRPLFRDLYACLAGTGLFIAALSLVGHIFDSEAFHEVVIFGALGLNATFGYILLFSALLMTRPGWGFMSILSSPGLGSAMLRRTLPFAVFGPLALCWLALAAVEAGLVESNVRLSVLAIAMSVMLIAVLSWAALRENASAEDLVESNERLQQALSDRGILLKEVYHRVKNNLQFVDAMLALEGTVFKDEVSARRLEDIRTRLQAMALVHQQLVASQDLASVDLKTFLAELCDNLARGAGLDDRGIGLSLEAGHLRVHLERAVPLGLIVSELISNAIKYAFPGDGGGEIRIVAEAGHDNGIRVTISDNGIGRSLDQGDGEGFGRMIVRSLASQLGAQMTERNETGYVVELSLPAERDSES